MTCSHLQVCFEDDHSSSAIKWFLFGLLRWILFFLPDKAVEIYCWLGSSCSFGFLFYKNWTAAVRTPHCFHCMAGQKIPSSQSWLSRSNFISGEVKGTTEVKQQNRPLFPCFPFFPVLLQHYSFLTGQELISKNIVFSDNPVKGFCSWFADRTTVFFKNKISNYHNSSL